jgi:hypothetical protein
MRRKAPLYPESRNKNTSEDDETDVASPEPPVGSNTFVQCSILHHAACFMLVDALNPATST